MARTLQRAELQALIEKVAGAESLAEAAALAEIAVPTLNYRLQAARALGLETPDWHLERIRKTLRLLEANGGNCARVAEQLGITEQGVRARLEAARRQGIALPPRRAQGRPTAIECQSEARAGLQSWTLHVGVGFSA